MEEEEKEDIDTAVDRLNQAVENMDRRIRTIEEGIIRPEKTLSVRLVSALHKVFITFYRKKLYLLMMFSIMSLVGAIYFTLFFVVGLKSFLGIPIQIYRLSLSITFAFLIGIPLSLMVYESKNKNIVKGKVTSATSGVLAGGAATVSSLGGTTLGASGGTIISSCASMVGAPIASFTGSASSVAVSGISTIVGTVVGPVLMAAAVIISYIGFNKSVKDFYRRRR